MSTDLFVKQFLMKIKNKEAVVVPFNANTRNISEALTANQLKFFLNMPFTASFSLFSSFQYI